MLGRVIPPVGQQVKDIVRRDRDANLRRVGIDHRHGVLRVNRWYLIRGGDKESVKEQVENDPPLLEPRQEANRQPPHRGPHLRQQNR